MMTPTFLQRDQAEADKIGHRVVSAQTSESMRYLMRSNATHGSASIANIPGYYVGGKTGTADKIVHGHYSTGQGVHDLHGDHAGRQAEISLPGDLRRAAGCPATTASTPPPRTPAAPPAR